jgi:chloramphenicol 3-O phosphotransferase
VTVTIVPVVVLNGGSSSGKSSIARALQGLLGPTWMTLGVDDLVRALPGGDRPLGSQMSVQVGPDGSVVVGDDFRRAEVAWYQGLAAIGRAGTGLIIDEVFLGGRSSQARLARALEGLAVVWVGVRCSPDVAAARERRRPDRVGGMALSQAERVHEGIEYDLVVDATHVSALDCARSIAARVAQFRGPVGHGAHGRADHERGDAPT